MRKCRKRMAAMCLAASLLLTGCQTGKSESVKDAAVVTGESEESTSTSVDIAATDVVAFKGDYSEKAKNAEWSLDDSVQISLNNDNTQVKGEGVTVTGSDIQITQGGTYVLTGKLEDGTILVSAPEDQNVQLVLNGANITCSDYAPVVIETAKNVYVTLADETDNVITDGKEYTYEKTDTIQPTAALFSKTDLVLNGTGTLTVQANYKDGITSKDDLECISGTIQITSVDDAIVGKDSVSIMGGQFSIVAEGDGIKTTNTEDTQKGFIVVDGGTFEINSMNDGFQAVTQLIVNDGTFVVETNGGSANASIHSSGEENSDWKKPAGGFGRHEMQNSDGNGTASENGTPPEMGAAGENGTPPEMGAAGENGTPPEMGTPPDNGTAGENTTSDQAAPDGNTNSSESAESQETAQTEESTSAKAFKAGTAVGIFGGTFTIDSSDDAVHSNGAVRIAAGALAVSSGDDGIHSDTDMLLEGGTIKISKAYEGIESKNVTVSGGKINLTASDDGINVAGGNDSSSINGRPGQNSFANEDSSTGKLTITDGELIVSSEGDGLDSNGSIYMSGGKVTVNGPTNNGNGALDYDSGFELVGGELYIAGSSGMAQVPSESSTQPFVAVTFDSTVIGGTETVITDSKGTVVAKWTPSKDYTMVCVANGEITASETYTITAGSVTATAEGGTTSTVGQGGGHGGGMNRPNRQ